MNCIQLYLHQVRQRLLAFVLASHHLYRAAVNDIKSLAARALLDDRVPRLEGLIHQRLRHIVQVILRQAAEQMNFFQKDDAFGNRTHKGILA